MKPKHYPIILSLHFFLFPLALQSQSSLGLLVGSNLCNIDLDAAEAYTGYYAGLHSQILITSKWSIASNLIYSKKGWGFGKVEPLDEEGKMHHHYLDLQLAGEYNITPSLSASVGVEAGRLLKTRRVPTESFFEDLYEKGNFSFLLGAGFQILKSIRLEAKYLHGVSHMIRAHQTDNNGNPLGEFKDGRFRTFQVGIASDIITLRKKK